MGRSEELFARAVKRIPGGVNSPVRAYGSVGLAPRFIARANRQHIYDVEGKEYVDDVGSWGPMVLGLSLIHIYRAPLPPWGCAAAGWGGRSLL